MLNHNMIHVFSVATKSHTVNALLVIYSPTLTRLQTVDVKRPLHFINRNAIECE